MAETLALVGLASNVLQFIDTGGKAVSYLRELYKGGSLKENDGIEARIRLLQDSLTKLKENSSVKSDVNLAAMIDRCFKLSKDLMGILEDLKPKKQRNKFMEATSKSLKTILKREKIKDLERRLESMQASICSYLDVLLR
jgi:Mg2+ and Co2+ transporter CorA